MKKALVITGGYINFEKTKKFCQDYSLVIAADSGFSASKKLEITPDIVLGDFDSLCEEIEVSAEVIKVPAEKDETDTMLACRTAVERGYKSIAIIGGTGGRQDHFLANVFLLEALCKNGISAILTDGENTLRIINNEKIKIKKSGGYFSVFALEDCTVSLSGCKYPLEKFVLTRTNPLAVSNEVTDEYAIISVEGIAIICESEK